MGEVTEIAWCDATFNPWIGCSKVSPGCSNCYASVDTFARRSRANGLELWGVDAARHVTSDECWRQPAKWNRAAERDGVRRRVFCGSLCDVFEDRPDLRDARKRLWQVVAQTPHLDWLLLTKRPENAAHLWHLAALRAWDDGGPDAADWQPNVWLGTTAEDQQRADERIPHLLAAPAALHFVSYEPALGAVNFRAYMPPERGTCGAPKQPCRHSLAHSDAAIDWLIVGGESGSHARPFDLAWARSAVEQCEAAGVACFVKQMGSNPIVTERLTCNGCTPDGALCPGHYAGRRIPFRHRSGADPSEWPAELRIREFPTLTTTDR